MLGSCALVRTGIANIQISDALYRTVLLMLQLAVYNIRLLGLVKFHPRKTLTFPWNMEFKGTNASPGH